MKFKSPISIRVGERTELDRKFARCIESLPEGAILSEEIKRQFVAGFEVKEEKSAIEALRERIEQQAIALKKLEGKIKRGVVAEEEAPIDTDEDKKRLAAELAASMTDW